MRDLSTPYDSNGAKPTVFSGIIVKTANHHGKVLFFLYTLRPFQNKRYGSR